MANEIAASAGTQTETVSAERAAADTGDVSAFLEASRERRAGKAPEAVTRAKTTEQADGAASGAQGRAAAVPGKGGAAAKGPKPGDVAADERLTTRVREAVDLSTAELRKQNRELAEQLEAIRVKGTASTTEQAGAGAGETKAERKALTSAEIREYQSRPGAPKLDDKDAAGAFLYETTQDHAIAMADFIREARAEERARTSEQSTAHVERVKREAARVTGFSERVEAFKKANPDKLIDNGNGGKAIKLSPEVAALHGFGKLAAINQERQSKGLQPLPATVDHAIMEELYDSEIPMEIGIYLSENPAELATLRKAQSPAQLTRAVGALEERVRKITPTTEAAAGAAASTRKDTTEARREAEAAVDRSVSSTKPLKGNLGRPGGADADPEQTALAKGDFGMFQETQRARRIELLNSRSGRRG